MSSGALSNQDLTDDGSYDLSAYFMFNDDPTGGEDVLTSTTMSLTRHETARGPLHHQQEEQVKFEFDPDVSFDLGISPVDSEDFRLDKAQQEASSGLVLENQGGDRKTNGRLGNHLKVNPHNKYLESHYDAVRIQKGLAMIDNIYCNDKEIPRRRRGRTTQTTRREIHEPVLEEECQLPIELAVDEGSEIAGFSLRPSAPLDSPVVKNGKHRVTFVEPSQENTARHSIHNQVPSNPVLDHSLPRPSKQDMEAYVPPSNIKILGHPSRKDIDGHTDIEKDDDLSITNALAVDRFISAPRLCKGTKSIPSLVCVEPIKDNDRDFILLSQDPIKDRNMNGVLSIFRPTTAFSSATSTTYAADQSFSNSEKSFHDQDGKAWNRVKQHLEQLPFVMYVPSDWSEEITSAGSSHSIGSRRSLNSPTGINEFDERRPWRKGINKGNGKSSYHSSKEKDLIRRLKYQIKMLLSQATSFEDSITEHVAREKSSIREALSAANSPVHRLKSRLRIIEATYSSEEKHGVRDQSDMSVEKLKARLRKIELDFGKGSKIPV